MNGGNDAADGIGKQDRNAIGGLDGDSHTRLRSCQRIRGQLGMPFRRIHKLGSVNLMKDDEAISRHCQCRTERMPEPLLAQKQRRMPESV